MNYSCELDHPLTSITLVAVVGSQSLTLEVGQATREEGTCHSRGFTVALHFHSPGGYGDQRESGITVLYLGCSCCLPSARASFRGQLENRNHFSYFKQGGI